MRAAGVTGAFAVGMLLVAIVAGVPHSPLSPVLTTDDAPPAFLRWLARVFGVANLGRNLNGFLATVVILLSVALFVMAAVQAWRGHLPLSTAVVAGVAFNVVAFALPLMISRDVYHYSLYGRIASVHHANPYVVFPSAFPSDPFLRLMSEQWRNTPALYGPLFVQISALFTRLTDQLGQLVVAFKALALFGSVATLLMVTALAKRLRPERAAFAAVAFGWNPIVLYSTVGAGHFDSLIALCVVLALGCMVAARKAVPRRGLAWELLATALAATAALLKPPAGVLVLAVIAVAVAHRPPGQRLRRLLPHLVVAVVLLIGFALPFLQTKDPTLGASYLSRYRNWLAPSSLPTAILKYPLLGLGFDGAATASVVIIRVVFTALTVLGLVWAIRAGVGRDHSITPEAQAALWGWMLLVVLLTAPIVWPWYVLWVLPLVWLVPALPRVTILAMSVLMPAVMAVAERVDSPAFFGISIGYSAAIVLPILFAMFVWFMRDLRSRARAGLALDLDNSPGPASLTGGYFRGLAQRVTEILGRQRRTSTTPSSSA